MDGHAEAPPAPLPPAPVPGEASRQRLAKRTSQWPGEAAAAALERAELRRAWGSGREEARLRTELADAEATGKLQVVTAHFPGSAAQLLEAGQPVESTWTKVVTRFGGGRASISLQFVLKPRKDDGTDDTDAGGGPAPERLWHFLVRARELSRTTSGTDEDERHWAARLVLGTSGAGGTELRWAAVAAVHDHRALWPACREAHAAHALAGEDPALEALRVGGVLTWDVAVAVRDAGAPVEGWRQDLGSCC
uniref:Uncharacterized protein n=1 Tax=Pyrodinium bahamense TaxID=73915 RepID=A0A7S0A9R1_9DINO